MDDASREAVERPVRAAHEAGDFAGAAAAALEAYGREMHGYLLALLRSDDDAEEVFARFTERLWAGLSGFAWQSSFRTWAYAIARHEAMRYRRDEGRRARRVAPLPEGSALSAIAARIRTDTRTFLRTERRSKIAMLRDALPVEDRELLVLRVDRGLSYRDVAAVLHDGATPLDEEGLRRAAARLRKRFQILKEQLLERGRREGLVEEEP